MAGWIKLHRDLLDSQQFTSDWLCRLFIWCLLKANHTDSYFRNATIGPGQFVTGRLTAADELKVSPSKWYRGIETLVAMGCIGISSTNSWTTITVINWSTYQQFFDSNEQPMNSQRTADDTTSGQPADTSKECKNEKKVRRNTNTGASSFVRPTAEQVQAYCLERKNEVDVDTWMDHYESNGWMVGRNKMRDWKAAVRKWERMKIGSAKKPSKPFKQRLLTPEEEANYNPYGNYDS